MDDRLKEAYELLGFTEDIPKLDGVYIAVCAESDFQPYKIEVNMYQNLIDDDLLGTADRTAYHNGLSALMYKRVEDNDNA